MSVAPASVIAVQGAWTPPYFPRPFANDAVRTFDSHRRLKNHSQAILSILPPFPFSCYNME